MQAFIPLIYGPLTTIVICVVCFVLYRQLRKAGFLLLFAAYSLSLISKLGWSLLMYFGEPFYDHDMLRTAMFTVTFVQTTLKVAGFIVLLFEFRSVERPDSAEIIGGSEC